MTVYQYIISFKNKLNIFFFFLTSTVEFNKYHFTETFQLFKSTYYSNFERIILTSITIVISQWIYRSAVANFNQMNWLLSETGKYIKILSNMWCHVICIWNAWLICSKYPNIILLINKVASCLQANGLVCKAPLLYLSQANIKL